MTIRYFIRSLPFVVLVLVLVLVAVRTTTTTTTTTAATATTTATATRSLPSKLSRSLQYIIKCIYEKDLVHVEHACIFIYTEVP